MSADLVFLVCNYGVMPAWLPLYFVLRNVKTQTLTLEETAG